MESYHKEESIYHDPWVCNCKRWKEYNAASLTLLEQRKTFIMWALSALKRTELNVGPKTSFVTLYMNESVLIDEH